MGGAYGKASSHGSGRERNGITVGVFTRIIVIPMLMETLTMPPIHRPLLGDDPRHALALAEMLVLAGAGATLRVRNPAGDGQASALPA